MPRPDCSTHSTRRAPARHRPRTRARRPPRNRVARCRCSRGKLEIDPDPRASSGHPRCFHRLPTHRSDSARGLFTDSSIATVGGTCARRLPVSGSFVHADSRALAVPRVRRRPRGRRYHRRPCGARQSRWRPSMTRWRRPRTTTSGRKTVVRRARYRTIDETQFKDAPDFGQIDGQSSFQTPNRGPHRTSRGDGHGGTDVTESAAERFLRA